MELDELRERYDELDDIVIKLDSLIDELSIYTDFKEQLEIIKFDVEKELNVIEPELSKKYDEQDRQLEREYWNDQF